MEQYKYSPMIQQKDLEAFCNAHFKHGYFVHSVHQSGTFYSVLLERMDPEPISVQSGSGVSLPSIALSTEVKREVRKEKAKHRS